MKIAYIKVAVFVSVIAAFFLPHFRPLESDGDNMLTVYLNGVQVGVMGDIEEADECLIAARRELAGSSDEMVLAESDLTLPGQIALRKYHLITAARKFFSGRDQAFVRLPDISHHTHLHTV